jgi:Ni/Co efflux regulator RcnB
MRNLIFAALLAGAVASPALAQDQNDHRQHKEQNNPKAQQQQQRDGRHADRGNGANNQAPQAYRQPQMQVQQGQHPNWGGQHYAPGNAAPPQGAQQQAYRGYRGGYNGQAQQPQQQPPQQPHIVRNYNGQRDWNGQRGYYGQGQAVQQHYGQSGRYAYGGAGSWNRDWRSDRRYDWRHYRDSHRSVFQLGIYYDPFGYGYQAFNIGYRMAPVYFGQQYWIDPSMYQLPYPPPGTQWVRYWNDAVLVDMYSGEVVDVIHGFFW